MTPLSSIALDPHRAAVAHPDPKQSKAAMVELCDALGVERGSVEHVELKAELRRLGWTGASVVARRSSAEAMGSRHAEEGARASASFGGAPAGATLGAFRFR